MGVLVPFSITTQVPKMKSMLVFAALLAVGFAAEEAKAPVVVANPYFYGFPGYYNAPLNYAPYAHQVVSAPVAAPVAAPVTTPVAAPITTAYALPLWCLANLLLKMNSETPNTVTATSTLKNTKSEMDTLVYPEATNTSIPPVNSKPSTMSPMHWDSVSPIPDCPSTTPLCPLPPSMTELPLNPLSTMASHLNLLLTPLKLLLLRLNF